MTAEQHDYDHSVYTWIARLAIATIAMMLLSTIAHAQGSIAGKVTDSVSGLPVEAILVNALRADNSFAAEATTSTDEFGNYLLENLFDAQYVLYFEGIESTNTYLDTVYPNWYCPERFCDLGIATLIPAGSISTTIDMQIVHGGTISGRVTNAGTLQPVTAPVVDFYDRQGELVARTVGQDGAFEGTGLSSGDYFMTVEATGLIPEAYDDVTCPCDVTFSTPLRVSPGSSVELEIALEPISPELIISIADANLIEGDYGTSSMSFEVSLNRIANSNVSVSYSTSDSTATAGEDYIHTSGELVFPAGAFQATLEVPILGDIGYADLDGDESFHLALSNPSEGNLGSAASAVGSIVNDDLTKLEAYENLKLLRGDFIEEFIRPQAIPDGIFSGDAIANIDLDADGDMDVIAGVVLGENQSSERREVGEIHLFKNNLGKGFTLEPAGSSGHFVSIVVADFNNDGREDAYFAEHGYDLPPFPGHTDYLFLQTPDGGLRDVTEDAIPTIQDFAHGSCSGDFDRNDGIDVVTANGSSFKLLMNGGLGYFTDEADLRLPLGVISSDYIFSNNLHLAVPPEEWDNLYSGWWWCESLDVDNDLDIDIVVGGTNQDGIRTIDGDDLANRHLILFNDGTGRFSYDSIRSPVLSTVIPSTHTAVIEMLADDFNRDGCMDFVAVSTNYLEHEDINFFANDCSGRFSILHTETNAHFAGTVSQEDVDRDNVNEYVFFRDGPERQRVFFNTNGIFTSRRVFVSDYPNLSPATFLISSEDPIIFADTFD